LKLLLIYNRGVLAQSVYIGITGIGLVHTGRKEQLMDVTRMISKLRSERDDIDQAILRLERRDQTGSGRIQAAERPVTEIRKVNKAEEDS
jgi:hypothetical protein